MPRSRLDPGRPGSTVVLLALFDGAAHLAEQLASIAAQSHSPALILGSDDGSSDETRAVFARFAAGYSAGRAQLVDGPARGATANFLSLLARVGPGPDFVALSDQDDVWLPDKLARAIAALAPQGDRPALYGARSWETDERLQHPRLSRAMPAPLNFAHALVQNFAGGNTMVLNRAALDLVQRCLPGLPEPVVHDWWLYQLIAGAGGEIIFDEAPVLYYRQHADNQIGAAGSLRAKLARARAMLGGTYADWNARNIAALTHCAAELTPAARALLADFAAQRAAGLAGRLSLLRRHGLHRKGWLNQAGLWLAALLGRM